LFPGGVLKRPCRGDCRPDHDGNAHRNGTALRILPAPLGSHLRRLPLSRL